MRGCGFGNGIVERLGKDNSSFQSLIRAIESGLSASRPVSFFRTNQVPGKVFTARAQFLGD